MSVSEDRLDTPYKSIHPESELDKKLRLYDEADELYDRFINDINDSASGSNPEINENIL